ncbi:tetratricopeptide repeat protein [Flavobacteriaceae bacterium R38]|nr:tetratricopeptide repeat protein [Flavobacteriaceae bacterium R38]
MMVKRTKKLFEDIENYLDESNDSKGKSRLKERLNKYSDLYLEVEKHQDLKEALSDKDAIAFKEKLVAIGKELKTEEGNVPEETTEPKVTSMFFSWRIAATILVIIGLGSYFIINSLSPNKSDLLNQYFSVYPLEGVIRGDSLGSSLTKKLNVYSNGDYQSAIINLEELITENPGKEVLKIYLGNSYLQTNQVNKAIAEFQSIDSISMYYENAQWYLALSFLKTNQEVEAKEILRRLLKLNGAYNNKASDLLKELK